MLRNCFAIGWRNSDSCRFRDKDLLLEFHWFCECWCLWYFIQERKKKEWEGRMVSKKTEIFTGGQASSVSAQVPSKHRNPPLKQRHSSTLATQIPLTHWKKRKEKKASKRDWKKGKEVVLEQCWEDIHWRECIHSTKWHRFHQGTHHLSWSHTTTKKYEKSWTKNGFVVVDFTCTSTGRTRSIDRNAWAITASLGSNSRASRQYRTISTCLSTRTIPATPISTSLCSALWWTWHTRSFHASEWIWRRAWRNHTLGNGVNASTIRASNRAIGASSSGASSCWGYSRCGTHSSGCTNARRESPQVIQESYCAISTSKQQTTKERVPPVMLSAPPYNHKLPFESIHCGHQVYRAPGVVLVVPTPWVPYVPGKRRERINSIQNQSTTLFPFLFDNSPLAKTWSAPFIHVQMPEATLYFHKSLPPPNNQEINKSKKK